VILVRHHGPGQEWQGQRFTTTAAALAFERELPPDQRIDWSGFPGMELRTSPTDPRRKVGVCICCEARVLLPRKPGLTECDCGAPYHNLSGEFARAWLLTETGHPPAADILALRR
jgi:hypothetical protein